MLAIRLYTGQNDCWVNMKETHFQHNYTKWKYFDLSLANSIYKLHKLEPFKSKLYSGLTNINWPQKSNKSVGYLKSFVSSSINKKVAEHFAIIAPNGSFDNNCCILEFNEMLSSQLCCCDVSWISPHPDEQEILFKRGEIFYAEIKNHTSISINGTKYNKQMVCLSTVKLQNKKLYNVQEYLKWRDLETLNK